ncbi:MAG: TniB family NTP-binding protein [Mangrovicoccus sp.]
MSTENTRSTIQKVRKLYVPTPSFQTLEDRFLDVLDQRRADEADGMVGNVRGIVLVGQSGAGKTRAIQQLAYKNRKLLKTDSEQEICEFFSLKVPSPATMKVVGAATLRALGYRFSGEKRGPVIWDQVKVQLSLRKTLFLHLDEAQDLARYQTDKERQAVVNTLKSLLENSLWQVSIILGGMPDLKKIVNQDPQLARRLHPVEINRLHAVRDVDATLDIVLKYTAHAKIEAATSIKSESFARRLMHAGDYEFGLMIEFIVQALTKALKTEGFEARLDIKHFADVYFDRSACIDALNPFITDDFARINPRQIFDDDEPE